MSHKIDLWKSFLSINKPEESHYQKLNFVRYYQNPCVELAEHLNDVYADAGRKEKEILDQILNVCNDKWTYSSEFLQSYALDGGRFVKLSFLTFEVTGNF